MLPIRGILFAFALITGVITSYSLMAEEKVFDRLDGKGPSRNRVDVIEWEGNLEIHVYPRGALKGLSAKIDDRESGKKVMVLGYRFSPMKDAKPLVRRAILGFPFESGLKAFVDPSEKEFDKIALSNNGLSAPWKPYTLDASPAQWYPDGHPSNEDSTEQPFLGGKSIEEKEISKPGVDGGTVRGSQRAPASLINDSDFGI
jgi:hypothetical protein